VPRPEPPEVTAVDEMLAFAPPAPLVVPVVATDAALVPHAANPNAVIGARSLASLLIPLLIVCGSARAVNALGNETVRGNRPKEVAPICPALD
jgi:hypothetical protein